MEARERIKELMTSKNWTAYKLSKESGIAQSTLSDILNGKNKNPNLDTLAKIADALNVFVDSLTGESIGRIIEDRLKELNLTMEDLARRTKLPLNYLKSLEDIRPGGEDYNRVFYIAKALGINPAILRSALARQEIPYDGSDETSAWEDFDLDIEKLKDDVQALEKADEVLKSSGTSVIKAINDDLSEDEIITLAAHRAGHEGELSDEDKERVKLAIQIALAKNKK